MGSLAIIKKNLLAILLLASASSSGLSGCSSLLYQPSSTLYLDPQQLNLHPDEVQFDSGGIPLSGWYFSSHPGRPPKAVLVYFHGNSQNMTSHYLNLVWILPEGYDFFIFDYRGYGKSKGKPSPEGTVEDGKSAIRWAHQHWKNVPLVVLGQSLGGAIALRSAIEAKNEVPLLLVIADSTFASYQDTGKSVLSKHWLTWIFQPLAPLLLSDRYAPGKRVAELSPIPLLVIHGDQDQTIDIDLGKKLFEMAAPPKEFWEIPGGHHIDSMNRKDIRQKLLDKLARLRAPR